MKNRILLVVVASLASSILAAEPFVVNTPDELVQCVPTQLTWQGGVEPFTLSVLSGQEIAETFSGLTGDTFTWDTDLPAGSDVNFVLTDAANSEAETSIEEVLASSDSSCL